MTTEPEQALSALSIGLSPEEVVYLLNHLEAPSLPGVERDAFDALQPEQQQLTLQVAQRGLLAREFLLPEDGALTPNPLVLSILVPNVVPEHSLLLWHQAGTAEGRMYYGHSWQDVHVLRWMTPQGMHQFLLLSSKEALAKAVLDLLEVQAAPAANGLTHRLPTAQFEQAHTAATEQGLAAALALLQAGGLPAETAKALAADLAAPASLFSTVATHHAQDNLGSGFSLTVVQGQNTVWLVDYGPAAADGQVVIHQAAPGEIEQRVRAFVADF